VPEAWDTGRDAERGAVRHTDHSRLRIKSWICAAVVVLSNVFGNFLMKLGMPSSLESPASYILVLFRPTVAFGVALLVFWMLSRMALLSWADLSYVLPVTAIGYVLVAVAGKLWLHEAITGRRWSGIVLIVAGVALVSGGTAPQTVPRNEQAAGR
jgi:drug/metabolite transporter (DMT)-like permease